MFGIDYLLSPITLDHFRQEYLGKKALLIPGSNDKFSELFSWEDINHAINYGRLSYPLVKLALQDQKLKADALNNIRHWLKEGATLILNNVQTVDPIVDQFSRILGSELNSPINVNCYTSFPKKQGFNNHFDRHDVFIINLEGRKKWRVFEPSIKFPTEMYKLIPSGEPPDSDPYIECEMNEGDVLYIPRGHWHYAISVTPCIHLTVSPSTRTPSDFLVWLTEQLMWDNEYFRRDFPIIDAGELGGRRTDNDLPDHLEQFRKKTIEVLNDKNLLDRLVEFVMLQNNLSSSPDLQLPEQANLQNDISPDTVFTFPIGQKALIQYDEKKNRAVIKVREHKIELDGVPKALLETVFDGRKTITGNGILSACPELKWKKIKKFLLTFYDQRILVLEIPEK